jgi:hypothetical protein
VLHGLSSGGLLGLALCAAVWLGFTAAAQRRIGAMNTDRPAVLAPRAAVRAVACVLALAAAGVLLILLGPRG